MLCKNARALNNEIFLSYSPFLQKFALDVMCQSHFTGNNLATVSFSPFFIFAWDLINEPKTSPL